MRRIVYSICALCAFMMLLSADITPQQRYIDKFAGIAVQEMYRSGIPASITLAQGLLESRYGLSALAAEGHNHFGIKCHKDWKGKSMKVDDDRKGECFRAYDDDIDSFHDHSDFLRYRDRYKFLFDYDIKDYKAWCYGLSKAGYATDPNYPAKLIKMIEDYDLTRFDKAKPSDFKSDNAVAQSGPTNRRALYPAQKKQDTVKEEPEKMTKAERKAEKKAERKTRVEKGRQEPSAMPEELPEPPNALEEVEVASKDLKEEFHFTMARKVYTQNGVPFVYAREDESYASLAEENKLFLKEILKFNDLPFDCKLLPGTVVYLQAKKPQAKKGLDKYIVEQDDEQLRDICQRFAVRQKSIMKLNGFSDKHQLREGDTIILRK